MYKGSQKNGTGFERDVPHRERREAETTQPVGKEENKRFDNDVESRNRCEGIDGNW